MRAIEDHSLRRLAGWVIDAVGDTGVNVLTYMLGPEAQHGWELVAWHDETGEHWRVEGDRAYDAAIELARLTGVELDDG